MKIHSDSKEIILPFLKWAGGKRWLADAHKHLLDHEYDRLVEPFLGGGAVFFSARPRRSLLSDKNPDLIECYQVIRSDWKSIVNQLQKHHELHSREHFYSVRATKPGNSTERAARLIYLNRTCWNGLYRVNLKGEFNVPIGTKKNVILPSDNFEGIAEALRTAEINCCDFEQSIASAKKGDFVFVDPPYTVKHNNNGFVKYNEGLFSWHDQIRLKEAVVSAIDRGAKVLVTNANHACVRELYENIGEHVVLNRASVISGSASGRGRYEEIIIRCF